MPAHRDTPASMCRRVGSLPSAALSFKSFAAMSKSVSGHLPLYKLIDGLPRTLDELSAETGVSKRSILNYIQRGAVDRAIGRTRSAHYTDKHVRQVLRVKEALQNGFRISEARAFGRPPARVKGPRQSQEPEVVQRYLVDDGVYLVIEAGITRKKEALVRRILKLVDGWS